jgi:hypothetical protein
MTEYEAIRVLCEFIKSAPFRMVLSREKTKQEIAMEALDVLRIFLIEKQERKND